MGIDIDHHHVRKSKRTTTKSKNPENLVLIKLWKCLARRTKAPFPQLVSERLVKSKVYRPPMSLSKLAKNVKNNKIAVVVGTITDDTRLVNVPQMTVAARKFTESARQRILKAGGQCWTLDQLAQNAPTGKNTILLRGSRFRKALKHFGAAPGAKGSKTRPYVRSKGRKFEKKK